MLLNLKIMTEEEGGWSIGRCRAWNNVSAKKHLKLCQRWLWWCWWCFAGDGNCLRLAVSMYSKRCRVWNDEHASAIQPSTFFLQLKWRTRSLGWSQCCLVDNDEDDDLIAVCFSGIHWWLLCHWKSLTTASNITLYVGYRSENLCQTSIKDI